MDGGLPDPDSSPLYQKPLQLKGDAPQVVVVRAQAVLPDGTAGPVTSGSYVMGLHTALPVLSIIADPADLWSSETGIYVNHEARGREWERPVDLTYVEAGGENDFHAGAGLRVHGGWTRQDNYLITIVFLHQLNFP